MTVKAIEDTLAIIKVATVALLRARAAGTPLVAAVQSPEFLAAVAQAGPELPEAAQEALHLNLLDDLELGRWIYGAVADIVAAVRYVPATGGAALGAA